MQHDVESVFSFTVTVKHNLNEKQQDALRELIAIINSDVETVTLKAEHSSREQVQYDVASVTKAVRHVGIHLSTIPSQTSLLTELND